MTPQAKVILKNSLSKFKQADKPKQSEMVDLVKKRLKQHNNALKTIGYGYADYFVEAGRVFLRIIKN